jgi:phage terminase small subunit
MRALHPRWRKCVEMLFVAQGNQTQALRLAGYEGASDSLSSMAWRMFSDDRVRKALREECDRRVETLEPEVMGITLEIVRDLATKPADRLRAAAMLWDRSNPVVTKSLIKVEHHLSEPEREIQHYRALQRLGAPRDAFLQRFGPNGLPRVEALVLAEENKRRQIEGDVVDVEYDEIEVEPSIDNPDMIVASETVDEDLE